MQTLDKIYPPKLEVFPSHENLLPKLKSLVRHSFPFILKISIGGFILLSLQILAIGICDRLGVSPKTSFLVSSLLYVVGLGLLATIGSVKMSENVAEIDETFNPKNIGEPICKMLIIRKKGEQK